jgi:hypothetical protein
MIGIGDFEFFMPLQLSGVRLPERTDSGNASVDERLRKTILRVSQAIFFIFLLWNSSRRYNLIF